MRYAAVVMMASEGIEYIGWMLTLDWMISIVYMYLISFVLHQGVV